MYSLLKRSTGNAAKELVDFAQTLVRTKSLSYGEAKVADLVEAQMKKVGYDQVLRDGAGNVIGIMQGRENAPTILLTSHMDTVAEDCSGQWEEDPFKGTVRDGRLIGLGAADCKGGLAAQVMAGAVLKNAMLPLRGNLVVAATVAEENGSSVGVRELLAKTLPALALEPQMVLLGEPTSLGLYYGHDGWVEIEVSMEGADHGALQGAARALHTELERQEKGYSRMGSREEMLVADPVFDQSGEGHRAMLRINHRVTPPMDTGRIVSQIHRSAELSMQHHGPMSVAVEVRETTRTLYTGQQTVVRRVANAWETDPFDPMFERARQCLNAAGCTARPGKWQLGRLGMGTAGAVIAREFELPVLGYGPGDEEQAHRPNEFVDTNMLVEAAFGTAAIVHGIVGIPVLGWSSDEI